MWKNPWLNGLVTIDPDIDPGMYACTIEQVTLAAMLGILDRYPLTDLIIITSHMEIGCQ